MTSREKFEAWWEVNYHNGNPPRFGWEAWRDGDGYKIDDDESELDGMWQSWQAAESASEQQLEESQREFRAVDATIHNLELQLTDLAEQIANAESKCRDLAAENAGLKATCDDRRTFIMNGVQLGYIKVPTVESDPALETIRVAVSLQEPTPSTDAFLAEVRAQGVEMMAAEADQLMNEFGDDSYKVMVTADLQRFANAFAAQLRKGAAL